MYTFLHIEDSMEDREVLQDTVKRTNAEAHDELYKIIPATSFSEGRNMVSDKLNGVIVDIKLDGEHNGNDIIREIMNTWRVPVVVLTGTPDVDPEIMGAIPVFIKGQAKMEDVLKALKTVSDTGLFNIFNGAGILENELNRVFWNNLYPHINIWKEKKGKGIDTEKVLLRYTISHILELAENYNLPYETEEMYILMPTDSIGVKTGSIVKSLSTGTYGIVLSPPCDLALHGGTMKTDRILICEIEDHDTVTKNAIGDAKSASGMENCIKKAIANNINDYYHWLPENSFFVGGYINFRKVLTIAFEEFSQKYELLQVRVQEYFVKNIMNRFSTYYSRQGQPDFNFESEAKIIRERITKKERKES